MGHSGVFWIVVQRKEKWKKVNKVRNTPYGGHDINEILQQTKLILHSASPIAPPFPSGVECTAILPFLTYLRILSSSAGECVLALSHLILPALAQLHIEVMSVLQGCHDSDVGTDYFSFVVIFPSHHCSLFVVSLCVESGLSIVYSHALTHIVQ